EGSDRAPGAQADRPLKEETMGARVVDLRGARIVSNDCRVSRVREHAESKRDGLEPVLELGSEVSQSERQSRGCDGREVQPRSPTLRALGPDARVTTGPDQRGGHATEYRWVR